jgi:hypothetical protein
VYLFAFLDLQEFISNSNLMISASPVAMLNLPEATCIPAMGWKKTMMFLALCTARPNTAGTFQ